MTPLILILAHFLVAVDGAAYPAPTPAARLDERQAYDVPTIWSPFVVGTSVSYGSFGFSSQTVTTMGNNWNWCSIGVTNCLVMTGCRFGTILYPGTSYVCSSTAGCGTEYLYSTIGADVDLLRYACYDTTGVTTRTFLLESPTAVGPILTNPNPSTTPTTTPTTTTPSTPGPTTTTPSVPGVPAQTSPASSSSSKTPTGAIVGGVVGGLAVLVLGVIAVVLLLRRRRQQPPAQPPVAAPEIVQQQQQQQPPPVAPYGPKYGAYATTSPTGSNFPLPVYQNPANPKDAPYVPPVVQQTGNPTNNYAYNYDPSPGAPVPAPTYQPHEGNNPAATLSGPMELSAYPAPMPGAVEMNADQTQR